MQNLDFYTAIEVLWGIDPHLRRYNADAQNAIRTLVDELGAHFNIDNRALMWQILEDLDFYGDETPQYLVEVLNQQAT